MTLYSGWPSALVRGTQAREGIVFDGQDLWLVPSTASAVAIIFVIGRSQLVRECRGVQEYFEIRCVPDS